MATKRLLIIGTGGHGRSVAEAVLLRNDYVLTGFLDDAAESAQRLWDWPVWGTTAVLGAYRNQVDAVFVAIGNNALRETLHQRVQAEGLALATVIHPAAAVSHRAAIGQGSAVMAGAVVGTGVELGEGVIVNCGAVVDHDCTVEPFGHLGVNAGMAGGSILGRRAWMQVGASIAQGAKVAADRVLLPGEVVARA
ncbi:sugar O-acyltransferase (sialic acid O-acetyltransferase NeuD family) [Variovorax boronicumulans]|uniref:Sugar O-acyltransferase (Sialic acid O-acetyltransferase NeuD family) n=1 Tax=Variovorax boronicumulans TaxID=436515 RepID=A0AAW8D2A6_9BURK|nr:NeuD/PglB/VioB family sugar acetyltransferase [Variovorax boronicumulans]MDP9894166.1 sugar O-acyltransferase (sialic acid O-acetyltransferase NeuD family) [Variovorax boronicumulans]MDQ0053985.1 sugar O-acyltransferase (sialic acid O-acetyltransferase NeuD family) [Variovorax boronicumulans]